MRTLIDGRLYPSLPQFFTSRLTVQTSAAAQDASGQAIPGWSELPGHVNMPCALAPEVAQRRSQEDRTTAFTALSRTRRALLAGYFPAIREQMRAATEGRNWDILAVEFDSQHSMTRLMIEEVTT